MVMPIYSTFFLIFTLANMGLPGLSNFVGELLVLLGVYTNSTSTAFLAAIGTVLGAVYSIWIYNRIMFGVIQTEFITEYCDVNKREFFILFLLSSISFFFGIYPNCIFSVLHYTFLYSFDFWFDGLV